MNYIINPLILIFQSFFRYSGFQWVFRKFIPVPNSDDLPTGMIWLVGIYVAFYGLASNRYESKVDLQESRMSSVLVLLSVDRKIAVEQLISVQNQTVPPAPVFTSPLSAWETMFGNEIRHQETVDNVKTIIVGLKYDLTNMNLKGADLSGSQVNLSDANFTGSNLNGVNLSDANLESANLTRADLEGAKLSAAILNKANLTDSYGYEVEELEKAKLDTSTILSGFIQTPINIQPGDNYEAVQINGENASTAVMYDSRRGYFLKIAAFGKYSEYSEDEIEILMDGQKVYNNYFDENIYGPFLYIPSHKPAIIEVNAGVYEDKMEEGLQFDLDMSSGGYHYADFIYEDLKEADKYMVSINQQEMEDNDLSDYFEKDILVKAVVLDSNRKSTKILIPPLSRRPVGVYFDEYYKDKEGLIPKCIAVLRKYFIKADSEISSACYQQKFLMLQVPEKRLVDIYHDLSEYGVRFVIDGQEYEDYDDFEGLKETGLSEYVFDDW